MLEKKVAAKLIKYEIDHIRYLNTLESGLSKIFGLVDFDSPDVPSLNFELLYYVLDELGVPNDTEVARDDYNNLYSDLYWKKKVTDKDINNFISSCLNIKNSKKRKL